MTKAPERIWAKTDAKPHELENWYLKEPATGMTPYIRADLYAKLVKAADELAEAVGAERNMVCQDFGMQLEASQAVDYALTAYNKTKEKLK